MWVKKDGTVINLKNTFDFSKENNYRISFYSGVSSSGSGYTFESEEVRNDVYGQIWSRLVNQLDYFDIDEYLN